MARKAYVGVNNVARQAKKIYVGVNNVARKVKKGYIGVANVARLFFSGIPRLVYHKDYFSTGTYAKTTSAYNGRYGFIGGSDQSGHTKDVVAFDKDLVMTVPTSATYRPSQGIQINPYVIFVPYDYSGFDYYNQAQTHGTFTISGITSGYGFWALYNDAYAILYPKEIGYGYPNKLFLINSTLTVIPVDVSSYGEYEHVGFPCRTNNGNYALILGGEEESAGGGLASDYFSDGVEAVDTNGTIISLPDLPERRARALGVRAGDYALCAGGEVGANASVAQYVYTVYAYNQSLTRSNAPNLSARSNTFVWNINASASAGEYGIVSVYTQTYYNGNYTYTHKYDAYSSELVKQTFNTDKICEAGVSVGVGAVFSSNTVSNKLDAFSLD